MHGRCLRVRDASYPSTQDADSCEICCVTRNSERARCGPLCTHAVMHLFWGGILGWDFGPEFGKDFGRFLASFEGIFKVAVIDVAFFTILELNFNMCYKR